jgi:hypothetical protein
MIATKIAATAAAAALAAPAAGAATGVRFITDTLGGNGHPKRVQTYRIITDTLGGNGHPKTGVQVYRFITDTLGGNGGLDPAIGASTLGRDSGLAAAPVGTAGSGFDWGDAGIGAVAGTGSVLVLLGGMLVVLRRRGHIAA